MSCLFKVVPDDAHWPGGEIDAANKWGLPGVICTTCGSTWSNVGLAYPAVDLSVLPDEKAYRVARPVSLEAFIVLQRLVLPLMPDGSRPPPGTRFGPLIGKAKGAFNDFAWLNLWTLLIRSEALERLRQANIRNPIGVAPILTFRNNHPPSLLELQIEPHAQLAKGTVQRIAPSCPSCGRDPTPVPEHILICASSIPKHVDLFRARDFTTLILATERFADAVQSLKLSGVVFQRVNVV